MPRPVIRFEENEPKKINCQEESSIEMIVKPYVAGKCIVELQINAYPHCYFILDDSHKRKIKHKCEYEDPMDWNQCTIVFEVGCNKEDIFKTSFTATATNSKAEKSNPKNLNIDINCR